MPTLRLTIHVTCVLLVGVLSEPTPGRVPKVYNALITSNQNLEPSKAYPVYQPVLRDAAFGFPIHPPFYYGADFPINNGLVPISGLVPKAAAPPKAETPAPEAAPAPENVPEAAPSTDAPPDVTGDNSNSETKPTSSPPPPPPNTESPIPLNEFGLPSQVLPLGRIDPAFSGFTQVGPFTYTYPGIRLYDPYDPFSFSPYVNLPPIYRPSPNLLGPGFSLTPNKAVPEPVPAPKEAPEAPPTEPSDLNILNYSSKDPAIPNVPPPPLPQGGLKSDEE